MCIWVYVYMGMGIGIFVVLIFCVCVQKSELQLDSSVLFEAAVGKGRASQESNLESSDP